MRCHIVSVTLRPVLKVFLRTGTHTVILMPLRPSSKGIEQGLLLLVPHGGIHLLQYGMYAYGLASACP